MGFGLIVVGDEILSGRRQDKHFSKVVELLGARGLQLAWAEFVGDDPPRLTDTLRRSFAGATWSRTHTTGSPVSRWPTITSCRAFR